VRLVNFTSCDSGDLRRFFEAGARALGVPRDRWRRTVIVVTSAPKRSRGCATVGGDHVSIAIAPRSYNRSRRGFIRRLARLFEHEMAHHAGAEHEDMPHKRLYSLGPEPMWSRKLEIRRRGRTPDQLAVLRDLRNGTVGRRVERR
jgi:hypothetical protein